MKGFRNICIIHGKESVYPALYIGEFSKWIGLDCVDILSIQSNKSKVKDILDCNHFDIAIIFDDSFLPTKVQCMNSEISLEHVLTAEDSLVTTVKAIESFFMKEELNQILERLVNLWTTHHLVSIFYLYTALLICDHRNFLKELCKILKDVSMELKQLESNIQNSTPLEYVLFSKYNCAVKSTEFYSYMGLIPEFDIRNFLFEVNSIYEYDSGFPSVEYLKANIVEYDFQFRELKAVFLKDAINCCNIDVFKAKYLYEYAKWQKIVNKPFAYNTAIRQAYQMNPLNNNILHAEVVTFIDLNDCKFGIDLLMEVVPYWESSEIHLMSPTDIESYYKFNMLIEHYIDGPNVSERRMFYTESANTYRNFLKEILNTEITKVSDNCVIKKLYTHSLHLMVSEMILRLPTDYFKLKEENIIL